MKTRHNILAAVLMACASVFAFSSCDDDDPIPESEITWKISLPEMATEPEILGMEVAFTNINTRAEYKGAMGTTRAELPADAPRVTVALDADGMIAVKAVIPEGLYRIAAEGKISYRIQENLPATTANIRAYQETFTVNGPVVDMPQQEAVYYSPSEGFVIEEIFFTGTTYPNGDQYSQDQYIKIFNNSADTLFADGLAVCESAFLTVEKQTYTPDIMSSGVAVGSVFVIPGDGDDVMVAPGKSLLIAVNGSNHKETGYGRQEKNPDGIDLSKADFEYFDESKNPRFPDQQNPSVPDMDRWYTSSFTLTSFHNRGFHSFCLAKVGVDKDTYINDYKYDYSYDFVFDGEVYPMSQHCYYIPNSWILDAVNLSVESEFQWIVVDPSLDKSYTYCGKIDSDKTRYNKSVIRKTVSEENGRRILKDTNDSASDFEAEAVPSMK